jgi:uncharacterized RDD family membrane protein YckC
MADPDRGQTPRASTILCRRCGREVSSEAPRCPECGADPHTGRSGYRGGERDRVRVCEGHAIRFVAIAADFVILAGASLFVALIVYLVMVGMGKFAEVGKEPSSWPLWVIFGCAAFVYFWIGEAHWGRTLGKRFADLRVVRTDGGRIGYGAAFVRTLLRAVDWLPTAYLIGAVAIWVTKRNQRLGDLVAGTVVVRVRTVPTAPHQTEYVPTVPWPGDVEAAREQKE